MEIRRILVAAGVAAIVIGAVACGSSEGSADDPPWGLPTVSLPDDPAAVEAIFSAMPDRVAGLDRVEGGSNEADYEGDALVTVMRLGTASEDVTATTALEYLQLLSASAAAGEVEMQEQQLEGSLAYVVFDTTGDGRHVYLASWGAPGSEYLFGVKAASPAERTALVQAFVEAASGD